MAAAAVSASVNGLVKWTAVSKTAESITGNIELSPNQLVIQGGRYELTPVREVPSNQLSGVGMIVSVENPLEARLNRVNIPAKARLRNDNNICGPHDARWLLVVEDHAHNASGLSLAFFSGDKEPRLDYDAVAKGTALCGTLFYER